MDIREGSHGGPRGRLLWIYERGPMGALCGCEGEARERGGGEGWPANKSKSSALLELISGEVG
jgi:hypothetical protein